jgi:hypothetical protein
MKFRKQQLPAPPQSPETGEVQAARAMAAAINQGLPGGHFCRLMNTMDATPIRAAAGMTVDQLKEWFMRDENARNILRGVPTFLQFCTDFLAAAKEIYPGALPPGVA